MKTLFEQKLTKKEINYLLERYENFGVYGFNSFHAKVYIDDYMIFLDAYNKILEEDEKFHCTEYYTEKQKTKWYIDEIYNLLLTNY